MDIKRLAVGFLKANCYVISSGQETVVVDPGDEPEQIIRQIESKNAVLKYIILTHYHNDHVSGAKRVKVLAGGLILIHEDEKDFINFKPDRWLGDQEEIAIGASTLEVLHTPGHTPGSICLLGRDCIFTGDTLFADGYGRTDLAGGSEEDMRKSLDKLGAIIKPGMTVYPGHGEPFSSLTGAH